MINKQIIGNTRRTRKPVEDLTDEVFAAANSYMPTKTSQAPSKKTIETNNLQLKEHEKYEYFFAGKNEFNLYKKYVETNFPKAQEKGMQTFEELGKPTLENKLFKGSSPIINSAMNSAIKEEGLQVVTQAQLEYVKQNDVLNLSKIYSDTGMCLRIDSGANEVYAKDLVEQLGEKEKLPIYLPVISYNLTKKGNNFGFKIKDKSKILSLPILNSPDSKFNDEDIDLQTGFPKQLSENGGRSFWTRENGLARCFLNSNSDLDSSNSDLSDSINSGRVVLAKLRSG